MNDAVDLSARTSGLLPLLLFLLVAFGWLALVVLSYRFRSDRLRQLPADLAAAGVLVLGNVLFFWRPLFTAAHMPAGGGDLNSFFFTLHAYSARRIRDGELPLWNPTLHGGMPQLGNYQAGVVYPPNLIAYLAATPFSYGTLEWLAILHFLVASTGTYLLLRSLGAGRIGSVAGGLVFAYGGFMVAHLGHYSMISAAAWVPWLFWVVHRIVRTPSWNLAALLAGIVFLTATAGHQQTLLFALAGTGVWWLFLAGRETGVQLPGIGDYGSPDEELASWSDLRSNGGLLRLVQFGMAVGSGLALAAPMILPSLQLARRSVRSTLSFEQASEFSVQPVALLQLVLPTVFSSNPTNHWGAFSSGEIWGYAGAVTLVLAITAILLRQTAHRVFFTITGILALLYAVGPWSPLHGWVFQFVPLFDLVRAPARAYLYLNLAVAVLAGLAVSDLAVRVRNPGYRIRIVLARVIQVLTILIGVVALFVLPLFYSLILGVNDPPNRPMIAVDNLQMLLVFLLMLVAVLWLASRRFLRGAALGAALTLLIVFDLFSATMPFNPTDEDLVASYREPAVTAFLQERWQQDGPFRVAIRHTGLLPNFGSVDGLHVADGVFDPMQPAAYTSLVNVLSEIPENDGYDMLNVRFLVSPGDQDAPDGFERAFESESGTVVWERESGLPRAWFVSTVRDMPVERALDVVRADTFNPAEEVIIADPPLQPDRAATGHATILEYEPERIRIEVDSDGVGYLVLADGAYPGWTATVDGDEVDVVTANYGLRAVPVQNDTEIVEFRYDPEFERYGAVIALVGLLVVASMLVAPVIYRRRSARARADQ